MEKEEYLIVGYLMSRELLSDPQDFQPEMFQCVEVSTCPSETSSSDLKSRDKTYSKDMAFDTTLLIFRN